MPAHPTSPVQALDAGPMAILQGVSRLSSKVKAQRAEPQVSLPQESHVHRDQQDWGAEGKL